MESLLMLVIYLLILGLVVWLVQWALAAIPVPQPFRTIILAILGIALLIWLLRFLGLM